jgi:hypothetical protein
MEVLAQSVQEIKLEASMEVQNLLKPRWPAMEGAAHVLTGKEWEALCAYVQMLNDKLPELQEIMANSEEVLAGSLLGVEDELGAALSELGSGDSVEGGGIRECLEQHQMGGKFYQLAMLLKQMQQEKQQIQLSASTLPGPGQPDREPVMVNGIPVKGAVEQLQLQL